MPITAITDGELFNARSAPDYDWRAVYATERRQHIHLCRGCGYPMHPKEMGDLRFFAHNPGEERPGCDSIGEGPEHIGLKGAIASAAESVGATVELEVPFGHGIGRVDVLATMPGGKTWALEAQLAPLNLAAAVERDERYRSEYGATSWVHTGQRPWRHQVPALEIAAPDDHTVIGGVYLDNAGTILADAHDVAEAVPRVLEGRYAWVYAGRQSDGSGWGQYWDTLTADTAKAKASALRRARQRNRSPDGGVDVCAKTGIDLRTVDAPASRPAVGRTVVAPPTGPACICPGCGATATNAPPDWDRPWWCWPCLNRR